MYIGNQNNKKKILQFSICFVLTIVWVVSKYVYSVHVCMYYSFRWLQNKK